MRYSGRLCLDPPCRGVVSVDEAIPCLSVQSGSRAVDGCPCRRVPRLKKVGAWMRSSYWATCPSMASKVRGCAAVARPCSFFSLRWGWGEQWPETHAQRSGRSREPKDTMGGTRDGAVRGLVSVLCFPRTEGIRHVKHSATAAVWKGRPSFQGGPVRDALCPSPWLDARSRASYRCRLPVGGGEDPSTRLQLAVGQTRP